MGLDKTIVISGTDPSNPKCAKDIVDRLAQIERDTRAMHEETMRLCMFAGSMQGVLMDQGRSWNQAGDSCREVTTRIDALADCLSDAHLGAGSARRAIGETGVIMTAKFEWRPTR